MTGEINDAEPIKISMPDRKDIVVISDYYGSISTKQCKQKKLLGDDSRKYLVLEVAVFFPATVGKKIRFCLEDVNATWRALSRKFKPRTY
mgnify:CR=1 FL=1